jgi:hypothetical protein
MHIIGFLNARYDEEAREARALDHGHWNAVAESGARDQTTENFLLRHDPARVLREIAAKRALVEQWADRYDDNPYSASHEIADARDVLHTLASVYTNHPDYQQKWAP